MTAVAAPIREVRFPAMGTQVIVLATEPGPREAVGAVRDLFERWERTLSRFRPDSELSLVNAGAGSPVPAGPLLRAVTSEALRSAVATGGLFDPTLGHRMAALGYDRPFGSPAPAPRAVIRRRHVPGGWRAVIVDDAAGTITVPRGAALDLGGIAKGMAVDAAAALLEDAGVAASLVSAGGDMRAAGTVEGGWQIGFDEAPGSQVTLTAGAIATSSRSRRTWVHDGARRHHLLDPATGLPADSGLRAATVAAASCARAEVAAKAAFLLGPDRGTQFLERTGLPGLLVRADGGLVRVGNWPGDLHDDGDGTEATPWT